MQQMIAGGVFPFMYNQYICSCSPFHQFLLTEIIIPLIGDMQIEDTSNGVRRYRHTSKAEFTFYVLPF